MQPSPRFRLLAATLVVLLVITLVAPAPAEADVLTVLAITSLVIAGVIIIAYLVVANVEGARRADTGHTVWLACAEAGCHVVRAAAPARETSPQTP